MVPQWIAPQLLQINQKDLLGTFTASNVEFNRPRFDLLCSINHREKRQNLCILPFYCTLRTGFPGGSSNAVAR